MGKTSIVASVCKKLGYSKQDVTEVFNAIVKEIKDETLIEGSCIIIGLGTFKVYQSKARTRIDTLKNLGVLKIKAKKQIKFKQHKADIDKQSEKLN
jgi:nucleoid DNA-binding protein